MAQRPIPNGYYAMTADEFCSFLDDGAVPGPRDVPILVEIDGARFPVIKIVRSALDGAIVLRVPPTLGGNGG
jgi:hypothetical protein